MEIKITSDEIEVLRKVLHNVVIKSRTGEIGIMHGAERFVSTNNTFKKEEIKSIE
jgi:F0F1-type ATP synthase epsilon subunit